MKYILSIDQSTQATKVILFDETGKLVKRVDKAHKQIISEEGFVSHNPIEIYENTVNLVKELLEITKIQADNIVALGISNQRETTVMWDKNGIPFADAVVWQCSRAKEIAEKYMSYSDRVHKITGLQLSPYFPACKMKWLIDHVQPKDEYCLGTIDSWLIYKLTKGTSFKTDATNASRTQLYDIHTGKWSEELCKLFGIDQKNLAEIHDCNAVFGYTDIEGILPKEIPITAVMGDSHAALYGHGCHKDGQVKTTLGTGSSIMMNIGTKEKLSTNGLSTSVAYSIDGVRTFAIEGNINYAGAVISWLKNDLELIEDANETQKIILDSNPGDETVLVPAFTGLGAPYWNMHAKAIFYGMTRTTTWKELVKASVESIAYQITDILNAMENDTGISIKEVKADGGPSKNQYLMQFLAECAQNTVCVSLQEELSATGVAYMAGLTIGLYQKDNLFHQLKYDVYQNRFNRSEWQSQMNRWYEAINLIQGKGA